MSYKALIDSNLNLAFKMLRDMADDCVFTIKADRAFDFGTGETTGVDSTIITKGVLIEEEKSTKKSNTETKLLLFKTRDLPDLKSLDTVTIGGVVWDIGPDIQGNGSTVLAKILREA